MEEVSCKHFLFMRRLRTVVVCIYPEVTAQAIEILLGADPKHEVGTLKVLWKKFHTYVHSVPIKSNSGPNKLH